MESWGPGIYNPLLERCPASPSPIQALEGAACAVKMSHRVGVPRSRPGLAFCTLPGTESWPHTSQPVSLTKTWQVLVGRGVGVVTNPFRQCQP